MEIYCRDLMAFDEFLALERTQTRNSSRSALSVAAANYQLAGISRGIEGLAILLGWGIGEVLLQLDM
jgi:hypothetical protein